MGDNDFQQCVRQIKFKEIQFNPSLNLIQNKFNHRWFGLLKIYVTLRIRQIWSNIPLSIHKRKKKKQDCPRTVCHTLL